MYIDNFNVYIIIFPDFSQQKQACKTNVKPNEKVNEAGDCYDGLVWKYLIKAKEVHFPKNEWFKPLHSLF